MVLIMTLISIDLVYYLYKVFHLAHFVCSQTSRPISIGNNYATGYILSFQNKALAISTTFSG